MNNLYGLIQRRLDIRRNWKLVDVRVRGMVWTEAKIRAIDHQELAEFAFDLSDSLQKEFREKGVFVSFWRACRNGQVRIRR